MLTPAFHFRILEDFIPVFNEQAVIFVRNLKEQLHKKYIDIVPLVTLCTLDIICGEEKRVWVISSISSMQQTALQVVFCLGFCSLDQQGNHFFSESNLALCHQIKH